MNRKHYTRMENGQPVELLRRLPRFLETVEKYDRAGKPDPEGESLVCWSPDTIEAQGRLPEYGYEVFDSKPMLNPGPHDTEQPLTLADVKLIEGRPTGTHSKTTLAPLDLRRKLYAEGLELLRRTDWTQTADYVARHVQTSALWNTWRHGVRTKRKTLKEGTADPFSLTYDDPPYDIEDTIE